MDPKLSEQFFVRDNEEKDFGVLIDLTYRCALECPRCQRQEFFRDHGEKVWVKHFANGVSNQMARIHFT